MQPVKEQFELSNIRFDVVESKAAVSWIFASQKWKGALNDIDQSFRFYERLLTKKDVIAELEISDRDFNLLLPDHDFYGTFNALNNEMGFVNRVVFQAIYPRLVVQFKQEVALAAPKQADFVVTVDR
ncbi:MAG: hypothetical protein H7318_06740, partial [Oligoflexus sp.]|nr:hypothetical protein [Oligoflexus sp.]